MGQLINDSDVDMDFFENIRHIQLHRRGRAVRRLADLLRSQHALPPDHAHPTETEGSTSTATTRETVGSTPTTRETVGSTSTTTTAETDGSTSTATDTDTIITTTTTAETPVLGPKMRSESISAFILPIVTPFLFEKAYSKQSQLVEETVRLIGVVARLAEWKRYYPMLRYYLGKLQKEPEQQKILVRITVSVLDGFHFGLEDLKVDLFGVKDTEEEETGGGKKAIYDCVLKQILPKLHQSLGKKKTSEGVHRLGGKGSAVRRFDEDEDILRVPIALAAVKLLQHLPIQILENQLPSILLKVCQLLKSRSAEIREEIRRILGKIVHSLGPRFLPFILREMKAVLLRGYQVHVYIYTAHVLLSSIEERLTHGSLDSCTPDILQMCEEEMFGVTSEEKEVEAITKHLMEAKANKTSATFLLLGKFISAGLLNSVVSPLKQTLATKQNHKVTQKVGDVLKNFAFGLAENKGIPSNILLAFAYKVTQENLPSLMVTTRKRPLEESKESDRVGFRPQSTLILEKDPGRVGEAPKTFAKSNLHVVVEFSLQLVYSIIRKGKNETITSQSDVLTSSSTSTTDVTNKPKQTNSENKTTVDVENDAHDRKELVAVEMAGEIDPFVPLLLQGLKTKYDKVISLSVRCLNLCLRFPLPSLHSSISDFIGQLFVLLRQYAGMGEAARGDTFELIVMLFKVLTTVIREMEDYTMTPKQVEILLHYVEQDVLDTQKQATAFSLLKAIVGRKLINAEIPTVVWKIQELSITSLAEHVRAQARQVVLHYVLYHPSGKNPRRQLEFFLTQLEYEFEDGRISTLEMLHAIFQKLTLEKLEEFCSMCTIQLCTRLANEESAKCRRLVGVVIQTLVGRVSSSYRDTIFNFATDWLHSEKDVHIKLASQLIGIFCVVEKQEFSKRVEAILPLFAGKINPSRYKLELDPETRDSVLKKQTGQHVLSLLFATMCRFLALNPEVVRRKADATTLKEIWESVIVHLRFPRLDVRLGAANFCGQLFSVYDTAEFAVTSKTKKKRIEDFLLSDPKARVKDLCAALCTQFKAKDFMSSELADQVVKNLVFLSRVLAQWGKSEEEEGVDLEWLGTRLVAVCRLEVSRNVKETIRRTAVFKWLAAVSLFCDEYQITALLRILMPQLHREIVIPDAKESPLSELAVEVGEMLKKRVGLDRYSAEVALCQKSSNEKKAKRKAQLALQAVSDPEKTARRRIKRHQAKSESKKRRMYAEKPYKLTKRKKSV